MTGKAFGWNDTIKNDGNDFKLLEDGTYPFEITKLEKEYFNGNKNVPPCPRAKLTLKVGTGANSTIVTDSILLYDGAEWRIAQFFRSIGAKKHGQEFEMNWDDDYIVGKVGTLELGTREYEYNGETRKTNTVKRYNDVSEVETEDEEW